MTYHVGSSEDLNRIPDRLPCQAYYLSLLSHSVKTVQKGCPLRITEVEPAIHQGIRLQRQPGWCGEIRVGFHHDRYICGPRNSEAERIRPKAEAGTSCQNSWIRKQPRGGRLLPEC